MKVMFFVSNKEATESEEVVNLEARLAEEGYEVEVGIADNDELTEKLKLYDVVSFPTVAVLAEDGRLVEIWRGRLPLINEIRYYLA